MADNESGARRPPPPPPGQKTMARPPPPPALRDKTPPPVSRQTPPSPLVAPKQGAPDPASGLFHLQETKQTFKEMVGEKFFSHFKKALNIVCASCGFTINKDFATRANTLLFRNATVAVFENGVMEIPLERLGNEVEIYGRLFPNMQAGEIATPSFAGLSSIPHGMFLSISSAGIELRFRTAAEIAAPPAPAPDQRMLLTARKLLAKMGKIDPSLSKAITVNGNSVLFRSGVELVEIAKIPEPGGEVRLYVNDIGWAAPQCKALLGICKASISEDKLAFIFMHKQVYFRIKENGFSLCASNKRESDASIYFVFLIE